MRKSLLLFALIFGLFVIGFASAACAPKVEKINQDPYPAIPGEYVKVVFKVTGAESADCSGLIFELMQDYPFSLDASESAIVDTKGGTFTTDYKSYLLIPYKLRVDKNALDGDAEVKVKYASKADALLDNYFSSTFKITIEDSRSDFEVSVKDYVAASNSLTLQILNIGKYDVEAVTIQISKQQNIDVKKTDRVIVGTLNANEDTTAGFEAIPKDGLINVTVLYNDANGVRRSVDKTVVFDSSYFTGRVADQKKGISGWYYLIGLVIIIVAIVLWRRRRKNAKKMGKQGSGNISF